MNKFNFPILRRVVIKHFSLYTKADFIDIDMTKDVFCLAGANGLGKSTFITIINYALTGIVKNPERQFTWYNSIPSFYSKSKGFASSYFDGRIGEDDHELAEVSIEFLVGKNEYLITRSFFESDELRVFEKKTNGKKILIPEESSYFDLNDLYKTHFTKDVNLSEFDQFVFLQSYVLTFDETHQLLFWDESLIERVLYLIFGVDTSKAKLADQLRKEYSKYDSDVRNLQWQITRTRNELNAVIKKIQTIDVNNTSNIELFEQHKALLEQSEETYTELNRITGDIKEADLNISDLSLKASLLRSEYETIFNQSLRDDTPVEKNPVVIEILRELKLKILTGEDYNDLLQSLPPAIREQYTNKTANTEGYFESLKKIDEQLTELSTKVKSFQNRKDRLLEEEKSASLRLTEIGNNISSIEKDNEELLRSIYKLKTDKDIATITQSYEEQISRLSAQKDESYKRRNKARNELNPLEETLSQAYVNAESKFIPIFNDYSKSFLGLDINVELSSSNKGPNLSLRIQDSRRRDSFQLSESQRYFIDIALRMALINLSTESATLLIDTPEGSLDIAYESRAGKMLADFSNENWKVIMTANINSSQLLLELASICREAKMKIERMTNWTTLSEVQQQENDRIEAAFANIEDKLGAHD